ncbi:hypothetical protein CDAR_219321 [Caerostris darwini]|uniref:Uncharacterized protein n=1 Tax=Caerostris darwini TaxID=1538125 RepID=A0AAV4PR12_9ARAC|nr:hypothetical protein CDAR_219321 [Caerostris darwini]
MPRARATAEGPIDSHHDLSVPPLHRQLRVSARKLHPRLSGHVTAPTPFAHPLPSNKEENGTVRGQRDGDEGLLESSLPQGRDRISNDGLFVDLFFLPRPPLPIGIFILTQRYF